MKSLRVEWQARALPQIYTVISPQTLCLSSECTLFSDDELVMMNGLVFDDFRPTLGLSNTHFSTSLPSGDGNFQMLQHVTLTIVIERHLMAGWPTWCVMAFAQFHLRAKVCFDLRLNHVCSWFTKTCDATSTRNTEDYVQFEPLESINGDLYRSSLVFTPSE